MTGIEAGWQERDLAAKFLAGIGTTFGTTFSFSYGQIRADKKVDPIPARIFTNGV